jgi:hypothetical protein
LATPSDSSSTQSISRRIGFLTDGNGDKVDKLRLKPMGKIASGSKRTTWGSKHERKYFSHKMQEEFEGFGM